MRRCLAFSIVIISVISGAARSATAQDAAAPSDVVLSGGLALTSFTQGNQAPPLCCGERDTWDTYGPELRAGFGYRVLSWLEPGVDLGAGWLTGDRGTVEIALFKLDSSLRVAFPFGDPTFVAPRIAWHFTHVAADFDDPAFSISKSALFLGPGVGIAVGQRLSREMAVGADASYEFISSNAELSRSWHAGVMVSWFP
jgi:hypothetical protein